MTKGSSYAEGDIVVIRRHPFHASTPPTKGLVYMSPEVPTPESWSDRLILSVEPCTIRFMCVILVAEGHAINNT